MRATIVRVRGALLADRTPAVLAADLAGAVAVAVVFWASLCALMLMGPQS
jgi:hypothetical protein